MEIKKIGILQSEVAVDINKNDVIKFLNEVLGINKAVAGVNESTNIDLKIFYEGKNPVSLNKIITYYRNTGFGEDKYDHEDNVILTTDINKIKLYISYLNILKALHNNEVIYGG